MNNMCLQILILALFFTQSILADMFTFPLKMKKGKGFDGDKHLRFLEQLRNSQDVDMKRQENTAIYTIEVQLGKSEKTFNIQVDTGSQVFWVTSSSCVECRNYYRNQYSCQERDGCLIDNKRELEPLIYADGTKISGQISSTIMKVGDLILEQQPFLLANKAENVISGGEDGLIGLGLFDQLGPQEKNWIQQLFDQKQISSPSFSIYFEIGEESILTIGGYNKDFIKDSQTVTYHNVEDQTQWLLKTSKVTFGKIQSNVKEQTPTLIDSGNTFITLKKTLFQEIKSSLESKFKVQVVNNQLMIECKDAEELPDLVFIMPDENNHDVSYTIPPSYYVFQYVDNLCYILISGRKDDNNKHTVGASFFLKYLTVFQYSPNKIGFVESISKLPSRDEKKFPTFGIVLLVIGSIVIVSIAVYCFVRFKNNRKQQYTANKVPQLTTIET